eukprot:5969796-Prymnesium_polylepis.1
MFPSQGSYYEDGMPGSDNWRAIQDATANGQLLTLGAATTDAAGVVQTFTPVVGNSCQYTVGQHTYKLTVAMATPPPPAPPPPPPPQPTPAWQSKLPCRTRLHRASRERRAASRLAPRTQPP